MYYHPISELDSQRFQNFLLDQRNPEGVLFARWLWETDFKNTSLQDCAFFVQKLSQTICKNNSMQNKQFFSCIRLAIYRTVFQNKKFQENLIQMLEPIRKSDTNLIQNIQKLKKKTAEDR
eukprot:UN32754